MDREANETEDTLLQTDAGEAEQPVDNADTVVAETDETSTRSKLPKVNIETEKRKGKSRFRKSAILLLVFLLCLGVCVGVNVWYSRTHYTIRFYQEASQYVTRNVRIIFISDLHSRQYGKDNEKLLADVKALKPDLILLGGDMINRDDTDYTPVLNLCEQLSQIAPLYGVLGNHEMERMYYGRNEKDLPERFEATGLTILRNESQIIRVGTNRIRVIGTEGTEDGFDQYGARERMDAMELDDHIYTIVVSHIPILFKEKLSTYHFDMGLAGHVHGGIVRLPGLGGLYSDEEGFFPEFDRGEYLLKNGGKLIISGGLGDSSAAPRINNTPELIVLDVNWCRE